jgi:hypothetical protein
MDVHAAYFRMKHNGSGSSGNAAGGIWQIASPHLPQITESRTSGSLSSLAALFNENSANNNLIKQTAVIPAVFFNTLHMAIEHRATDVLRSSLKYGLDPNQPGTTLKRVTPMPTPMQPTQQNIMRARYSIECRYCRKKNATTTMIKKRDYDDHYHHNLSSPLRSTDDINYSSYSYLIRLPPLYLAISRCNHEAVQLLLEHDACSNVQDPMGNAPLHLAVAKRPPCVECVYLLIKHHACSLVFNNRLQSPGQILRQLKQAEPGFFDLSSLKIKPKSKPNGATETNETTVAIGNELASKSRLKHIADAWNGSVNLLQAIVIRELFEPLNRIRLTVAALQQQQQQQQLQWQSTTNHRQRSRQQSPRHISSSNQSSSFANKAHSIIHTAASNLANARNLHLVKKVKDFFSLLLRLLLLLSFIIVYLF